MPENTPDATWGRTLRTTILQPATRARLNARAVDSAPAAQSSLPHTSTTIRPTVWLLGFSLAALFFLAEHEIGRVGTQVGDVSDQGNVELLVQEIDSGNQLRKLVFLSFAALGIGLIIKQGGNRWHPQLLLTALISAALVFCLLSVAWSSIPSQSMRRMGVVLCCVAGAAGVASRLSPREFCLMVFSALFPMLALSFLLDIGAGSRPWNGADRFGGTLHPNGTAVYCGVTALAAYVLSWNSRRKMVWLGLFAVCVVLLFFTKSRTTLAVLALTLAVGWFVSLSSRLRWCWAAGGLTLCAVALLVVGSMGTTVIEPVVDAVLLGRHEKVETLSGRIPLWEMLMEYARQRPMLGRGFSSFWTTPIIEEVSLTQQWPITSAHSAYLELVLGIGVIGMLLTASAVLAGAWTAVRRYSQTRDAGYAFIMLLLVFGMANGLLESIFVKPQFPTVLAFSGLALLAFYDRQSNRRCADATS